MALIVETGTGVAGANSLASPGACAEYHADRGNLTEASVQFVVDAVFAPPNGLTLPSTGASIPVNSIIRIDGAGEQSNRGYAYATAVTGDDLVVYWLDGMVSETSSVVVTVWGQDGGWWSTRSRLESSLINATEYVSARTWLGTPVSEVQGTPFPREGLFVAANGQFYRRGYEIPVDEVPLAVSHAVCHVALEDLSEQVNEVVSPDSQVLMSKVGPITTRFARKDTGVKLRKFPHVERMLWGLYVRRGRVRSLIAGGA